MAKGAQTARRASPAGEVSSMGRLANELMFVSVAYSEIEILDFQHVSPTRTRVSMAHRFTQAFNANDYRSIKAKLEHFGWSARGMEVVFMDTYVRRLAIRPIPLKTSSTPSVPPSLPPRRQSYLLMNLGEECTSLRLTLRLGDEVIATRRRTDQLTEKTRREGMLKLLYEKVKLLQYPQTDLRYLDILPISEAIFYKLEPVAQFLAHLDFHFDETQFRKTTSFAVKVAIRSYLDGMIPRLKTLGGELNPEHKPLATVFRYSSATGFKKILPYQLLLERVPEPFEIGSVSYDHRLSKRASKILRRCEKLYARAGYHLVFKQPAYCLWDWTRLRSETLPLIQGRWKHCKKLYPLQELVGPPRHQLML
jgi:hypothetical protein